MRLRPPTRVVDRYAVRTGRATIVSDGTPPGMSKESGIARSRACYVLSSITVMNRFSHVDLAAPPACGGGGKGGTLMPVIAGARCAPPFPPPPPAGGQGGRLHRARVNDHRARRRRAPPPFPPCGGSARADHGRASQRPRPLASAGFADRRCTTAAERWASCARALPCDALSLPKRGRCNRPPLSPPPPQGGERGGRSEWLRCGASSVMKVREGATKAHSSSLTSLG